MGPPGYAELLQGDVFERPEVLRQTPLRSARVVTNACAHFAEQMIGIEDDARRDGAPCEICCLRPVGPIGAWYDDVDEDVGVNECRGQSRSRVMAMTSSRSHAAGRRFLRRGRANRPELRSSAFSRQCRFSVVREPVPPHRSALDDENPPPSRRRCRSLSQISSGWSPDPLWLRAWYYLLTVLPIPASTRTSQEHAASAGQCRQPVGRRSGGDGHGRWRWRARRRRVGVEAGLRHQHLDHHVDLLLVAVADADDRLLDRVRRIFGDHQAGAAPAPAWRCRAPGRASASPTASLLTKVCSTAASCGISRVEHVAQPVMQLAKARGERGLVVGRTVPAATKRSELPRLSTTPQPVRRSPGSIPMMRIASVIPELYRLRTQDAREM